MNKKSRNYKCLLFLSKPFMMNMRNQGSKENLVVKFKEGICVKLCLKLWFESGWVFCNINNSEWFWKRLSRKKVLNNHLLKSLQKQPYADVLQNRCSWKYFAIFTGKPLYWSLVIINFQAFIQKRLQHRCFLVNIAKILRIRTAFFIEHLWWLLLSVW